MDSYDYSTYQPVQPAPRTTPTLSTWGEALVAAATGDAVMMSELLAGRHDDGRGVDLRTFRTSWQDVDFLLEARNIRIDAHFTLVEVAVERDHFDVVMLLTDVPNQPKANGASEPFAPPALHRAISTFVAPKAGEVNLADALRDFAFTTLAVRGVDEALAGLPQLALSGDFGNRQTFLLAREAVSLPLEGRQAACGSMTEDSYTQEGVDAAVAWWAQTLGHALGRSAEDALSSALPPWGLHALYTSGDGNCLLHGALLATLGVRDTRVPAAEEPGASTEEELNRRPARRTLRAALHHCIVNCRELRELLAHHGAQLEPAAAGVDTVESRSVEHGNSCDPAHVLALAHIFRRPIICYAAASVGEVRDLDEGRTMSQYASTGARMSGIYLPCLLCPSDCVSRDPILIAYTQGHFSALCSTELAGEDVVWKALGLAVQPNSIPIPLVDETRNALPLLFPPVDAPTDGAGVERFIAQYLDLLTTAPLGPPGTPTEELKPIVVTRQAIPPPSAELMEVSPADAYFAAVWQRRFSAPAEPREPRDAEKARTAPSASREDSWVHVTAEEAAPPDAGMPAHPVPVSGSATQPLILSGEAPGRDDDLVVVEGRPV